MASLTLLAAAAVALLTLNSRRTHGALVQDVCNECPSDCHVLDGKCLGPDGLPCCLRFDRSSLLLIVIETTDCTRPEESSATKMIGTGGGNFSLNTNTCSGFYLLRRGGCLKTLPPRLYCPYNATRAVTVTNNQISDFPSLSCLPHLGYLDLSGNRLQIVSREAFLGNPDLREIHLCSNQISYVHPEALQGLHKLKIFSISNNALLTIDISVFMLRHKFCHIDFNYNSIANVTNELNWKLNASKYYGPGFVSFAYNRFTGVEGQELFKTLGIVKPFKLVIFLKWGWDFRGNPLQCDCNLFMAANWLQILKSAIDRNYFDVHCVAPAAFKGWSLFDVPLKQMICDVKASCPESCSCQNRPAEATLIVNCSSRGMTSLPDVMPVDWLYDHDLTLDLDNNNFVQLMPMSYFKRTVRISLVGNNLEHIQEDLPRLWTKMQLIDLRQNRLKKISRTVQILKPEVLLIDQHTLACSCELIEWSPAWLAGASVGSEIRNVSCLTDEGRSLLLLSASRQDLNCDKTPAVSVAYHWLMGTVAFLLVVLAVLSTLFRYELRLLIHVAKQSLRRSSRAMTDYHDLDSIYKHYHVFISVSPESQEDMDWVRTSLLPRLETAGLTSYLPPRDCPPGSVEMDEVTKRLHDCASAVIVLSPDYVTSTSALFQFRQAFSYMVAHGCGPLFVLRLRHVPRQAVGDPHLRAMLTLRMSRDAEDGIHLVIAAASGFLVHPLTDRET